MRALCVQVWPSPDQEQLDKEDTMLRDIVGVGEFSRSFSEAESLISKSPMSYDAIVTNFCPDSLITRRESPSSLALAQLVHSSWPLYRIAFSFVSNLLNLNPFAAVVVYSGAGPNVAIHVKNELGDRIGWVGKSGTPEQDRLKLQTTLLKCLSEYQLVLDDRNNVRVVQQASRSPVLFSPEKRALVAVKPHFGCKRVIFPNEMMEFEYLINKKDVSEHELQMFLKSHPTFLLGNRFKSMRSHVYLRRDEEGKGSLIPDFMLEPVNPFDFWKVVDLKLPNDKIVKIINDNRKGFSSKVLDAIHQLREYRDYFDNHVYRERMGELGITAFKPEVSVIIGRDYGSLTIEDVIKARSDLSGLEVITYTELLERAKRMAWLLG